MIKIYYDLKIIDRRTQLCIQTSDEIINLEEQQNILINFREYLYNILLMSIGEINNIILLLLIREPKHPLLNIFLGFIHYFFIRLASNHTGQHLIINISSILVQFLTRLYNQLFILRKNTSPEISIRKLSILIQLLIESMIKNNQLIISLILSDK